MKRRSLSTSCEPQVLFEDLAAELRVADPRVVEGTIMNQRCLRFGTAFLALVDAKGAGLVVKLSISKVAALVARGEAVPFAPAGRTFKEWAAIPAVDRRRWRALLHEAVALASSASQTR